ncbi:DOK1-like protein [Mya arenaria]|uniref:DOK1-like protein n=1 Tax=Mya arenaria TaxID=6604 RepID=A0ABY7FDS9_MYAAR|nr:DOK1-like protein [Mya arenaria]
MANENLSRDMEISYCYKCALRKIKVGGAFYCQECSKRLCKDCAALHTAKKRHRGHEIREIMEYPKSPMTLADKDEIGSLINSPTGYNFIVDIASTPLAEKCKVVGKKILFIHVRGITVKEPSTGNGVFTYQLTWIRRYGNKSGIFYFEVGRKCPHSEGNIEMRCKDEKTAKVIQKSVLKCTQLYENKKSKDKTL